jgi:hypothetical protein
MEARDILLQKSPPPLAQRRVGQSHLTRNLHIRLSGSTQQNNPGSSDPSRMKRSRTGQASQLFTLPRTQNQNCFRSSRRSRHPHSALEMPIFPAILLRLIYGTGY